MWKKRFNRLLGGFFCCLFFCLQIPVITFAQEPDLYAKAAVLLDADSGRVLYGKNEEEKMAMASTTKIMTCILLLEQGDLEDTVKVSAYAESMPKVKLYLKKGESYQVKDLLYSLMLESHNDSAVALAEYVGKKYLPKELQEKDVSEYTMEESKKAVKVFAGLMSEKARTLGCENTYFITPNGLDATETVTLQDGQTLQKEHCTTAAELAKIMAYCIRKSPKREEFLQITATPNYAFTANGRSYSCVNHNSFLTMMQGAISGKTGFTNKAGYCYVGALESNGRTFVVALLACGWPNNRSYKWSDTKKLMQYGMEHYVWKSFDDEDVLFDEKKLTPLPVANGCTKVLGNTAYTSVAIAGRNGETKEGIMGEGVHSQREEDRKMEEGSTGILLRQDEQIKVECHCRESLTAPVKAGTVVGNIYYVVDDIIYKTEEIITTNTVDAVDFPWCLKQVFARYIHL